MVKTFDCIKCGGHHVRPINRNCKMEKDKDTPVDANSQILQELRNLSGRMTQMEDKMEALGSTVSSPARSKTSSMSPQRSPATSQRSQAIRSPEQDLILHTLSTLRQSRSIQEQVDTRIRELQGLDKGKFKSQRGGSETIWVKKEVAWPHNHVLGGSSKNRVNYDNLTISQWVSGFATIIRDESDLSIKNQMLEYLAEIMEDSHDFGWAAAKGSHAVLLCKMEEGRITWDETQKIDRVRRAYAHRSASLPQVTHSNKKSGTKDQSMPCRYYQKNSCSHKGNHDTGGRLYLHVCSYCHSQGKSAPHSLAPHSLQESKKRVLSKTTVKTIAFL